jgi:paraquat-inducible protein A
MNPALTAQAAKMLQCRECRLLMRQPSGHADGVANCPRCGSAVHPRLPNSIGRTWALVLTAFICLIPANLYPMMTIILKGQGEPSTIMDGVIVLVQLGMIPIALIIFTASIAIPFLKLLGLALILLSVQLKWNISPRQRTVLYDIIEIIGRWSMLDIFVVSVLVALVQLGALAEMEAGLAATFFVSAVIITIFAAQSFDTRLIWDAADDQERI